MLPSPRTRRPIRSRSATWLAIAAGMGLISLAEAAPPEVAPTAPDQAPTAVVPAPPLAPLPERYWLSAELIGPRGAQLDAAVSLVAPPIDDGLPRGGSPPPGEYVGSVETLEQALQWVHRHALTRVGDSPYGYAGGALHERFGVVMTALAVTPFTLGSQPYPWPSAAVLSVPPELGWKPASLASSRTPVYAAPAPRLPPASERYRIAQADDAVWLLEERDICDDAGQCTNWSTIMLRRADRFFAGWVPSTQVIPDAAWVGGPQERRFALRAGHRDRRAGITSFALIEQRHDRREAPVGVTIEHAADDWPPAGVEVIGEELVVLVGKRPVLTRHIELLSPL